MTENPGNTLSLLDYQMWEDSIDASAPVLIQLILDHRRQLWAPDSAIQQIYQMSEEELGQALIDSFREYKETSPQPSSLTQNFDQISKGFALTLKDLSVFFQNGGLDSTTQDVILNPEDTSQPYTINHTDAAAKLCCYAEQYLPDDIWQRSDALAKVKSHVDYHNKNPDLGNRFVQDTDLIHLSATQIFAKTMPIISQALKEAQQPNLATIAQCFATRSQAYANNILAKAITASEQNKAEIQTILECLANGDVYRNVMGLPEEKKTAEIIAFPTQPKAP